MQGTEEKEAHLRHSKAACAIEFKIKYPASEPSQVSRVETIPLSPWKLNHVGIIIALCWVCPMLEPMGVLANL